MTSLLDPVFLYEEKTLEQAVQADGKVKLNATLPLTREEFISFMKHVVSYGFFWDPNFYSVSYSCTVQIELITFGANPFDIFSTPNLGLFLNISLHNCQ